MVNGQRSKVNKERTTKRPNDNMKNSKWKMVIQILISILTALGTSLGVTSCMA